MTIERLITALNELIQTGHATPRTSVYVRENTNLHGAAWTTPRTLTTGPSPHPISDTHPPTTVLYIS